MIVEPDFLDHWKTQKMVSLLGENSPLLLIRLWAHCQMRHTDKLPIIAKDAEILAGICRFRGDPKQLWDAMINCRFIRLTKGGIVIHDWATTNSTLMRNWKNGQKGGRPKGSKNREKVENPKETQSEFGLTQTKPNHNPTITQIENGLTQTEPKRDLANPQLTEGKGREGRRGEEMGEDGDNAASGKPESSQNNGHFREADKDFIEKLKTIYGGIDVDGEVRKLQGWLLTPKGRGKKMTRSRLVNWLNRCDRPMSVAAQPTGLPDHVFKNEKGLLIDKRTGGPWNGGSR